MDRIASISMFPESIFWTFNSQSAIKHPFGGFITLIVIIIMGGTLVLELMTVFNQTQFTVTSSKRVANPV